MQPDGGIKPGHQQSGRNSLAGNVGQADCDASVGKGNVVKVVAADGLSRLVIVEALVPGRIRTLVREETELDLRGERELPLDV